MRYGHGFGSMAGFAGVAAERVHTCCLSLRLWSVKQRIRDWWSPERRDDPGSDSQQVSFRPRMVRKSHPRRSRALRCSAVIVNHTAQNVSPLDRTVPRGTDQSNRTVLIDALMWTRMVVICDVRSQRSAKMPLPEDQEPVEAFLANGANPSLSESICVWCSNRGADDRDILRREDGVKARRELGITVVDQEAHGERAILDLPNEAAALVESPRHWSGWSCSRPDGPGDFLTR